MNLLKFGSHSKTDQYIDNMFSCFSVTDVGDQLGVFYVKEKCRDHYLL